MKYLFAFIITLMLGSAHALESVLPTPTGPEISTVIIAPETSTPANANQMGADINPVRFLVGAGLTHGGDTMATASYTDGTTDKITAGSLLLFYAGVEYRLNDNVSIQGTIGYHVDSFKQAKNGDGSFSRIPIEVMAYYHLNDKFRLGGGLRFVNNAKLKLSGTPGFLIGPGNFNDTFASATGLVIEGEWLPDPTIGIKLRSVSGEKYQSNNFPSVLFKGDHIGILANLYF
ncbi:MAG: hypothetical protein ABL860_08700 [Candidatus Nitrotoga sp.]